MNFKIGDIVVGAPLGQTIIYSTEKRRYEVVDFDENKQTYSLKCLNGVFKDNTFHGISERHIAPYVIPVRIETYFD